MTGAGVVYSTATASGGASDGPANTATAIDVGTGVSGTLAAFAYSNPGDNALVQAYSATASGVVDGTAATASAGEADAGISFGQAVAAPVAFQSVALIDGLPLAANVSPILAANPNLAAAFAVAPSYFANAELGGERDTKGVSAETEVSTISMTINPALLANPQDLTIGLWAPTTLGGGPASLTFDVEVDGTDKIDRTFASASAATTYFTDHALVLGSIVRLELSGLVNLQASLSETNSSAGSGFYAGLLIGDGRPSSAADPGFSSLPCPFGPGHDRRFRRERRRSQRPVPAFVGIRISDPTSAANFRSWERCCDPWTGRRRDHVAKRDSRGSTANPGDFSFHGPKSPRKRARFMPSRGYGLGDRAPTRMPQFRPPANWR